jgi:hypothetical protein
VGRLDAADPAVSLNAKLLLLFLALAAAAPAHVGSPDVFYEGSAGPYRLFVTVRPPFVIPGVAEIEIRSASEDVREVHIVPLRLTGPGARLAPTPDVARRSKQDPQFYTGTLWIMQGGSWQVRVEADGARGKGSLSVPVPALAQGTKQMQKGLGALLVALMLVLALGVVSIAGASAREVRLEPGQKPGPADIRRGRVVMAATAALVALILYAGNRWWNLDAGDYRRNVYKPIQMSAEIQPEGQLHLRLRAEWFLRVDNLIPDHGHLMHLFVIRLPEMDRFWHLHPEQIGSGMFAQDLPALPAGHYQMFADIVHEGGLPETLVAQADFPQLVGKPLAGDDSGGEAPPLSQIDGSVFALPDGGRMIWERDQAPLRARQPAWFRFRVENAGGKPVQDLELYMGMQGHAAFVKTDRSVFAHIHPSGSAPMAAIALANGPDPHASHAMSASLPAVVSFPYGFPNPGEYRIFVQIKRAGRVETGVFDAKVMPAL